MGASRSADYTAARIDDLEAKAGGGFKLARHALGVEAFGMQVIDLPPDFERYPEHDHRGDGQEEVYVTLRGGGVIDIEGDRVELDPERLVRVGPTARRRVLPGSEGLRLLVIGGARGRPYDAPELSMPSSEKRLPVSAAEVRDRGRAPER